MRTVTDLPHKEVPFGQLWDDVNKRGNYSPENFRLPITNIILHTTVGSLNGTTAWFNNPASQVSAHYVIDTDGTIYRVVPENCVAFQSGNWNMNQKSIGIEHVDNGNNQAVRTPEQLAASAALVANICKTYNLPCDRNTVKKHNEIVATQCPGNLPIDSIVATALASLTPASPMHSYQMPEQEFINMVTKAREYDDLWIDLKLDPSLKTNPGSRKVILDDINRRLAEAMGKSAQIAPVNPVAVAPSDPSVPNSPANQPVSIWRKDVSQILTNIWGAVRGGRAN